MQRVTTEQKKQRKIASPKKHPLHLRSAPIGEGPKEEYHVSIVSWTVTKTSIAMPAENRKRGGRELTLDPQTLVL